MKALIDTNIFLEIILDQEKAKDARNLLNLFDNNDFYISDFSLHSIGLFLFRQNKYDVFNKFISDIIKNAGIEIVSLSSNNLQKLSNNVSRYNLDFDDAYQYVAAEEYNLQLISFDSDFTKPKEVEKPQSKFSVRGKQ